MKTTIVCGLLGAGKTTFIRRYVRTVTGKTVVLVNDFGKTGIDGEIFSVDGIESIELPSGCVCCTLKFDLITTIEKIRDTLSPENLLVEPSGVASPSGVLEVFGNLNVGPVTVVGLVDATEFLELYESQMYGAFFEDQIVNSDILLVNKVDIADEEKISGTISLVEGMNPGAIIVRTVNAVLDYPLPAVTGNRRPAIVRNPHFAFDTFSLMLEGEGPCPFYEDFFEDMARGMYGNIVRAKALVQTAEGPFRFDLSLGRVDHIPFGSTVSESRLVIIGSDLRKEGIAERLAPLFRSRQQVL
ncbi:MAG TPA: GTP-binding protein [Thermodesulfovibrionales bacterium]|nr:GTP-binding protein [Thermodesulfovibrionales bacterium]